MAIRHPEEGCIRAIAETLVGCPVGAIDAARAGGNNRVYRIECGGESLALKFYPPQDEDPRDRLGAEFRALGLIAGAGEAAVPRALAAAPDRHCALYAWIDGVPVTDPGPADVAALAAFLARIQDLRTREAAHAIAPASHACLSPAVALGILDGRYRHLRESAIAHEGLQAFIATALDPAVARHRAGAEAMLHAHGIDPHAPLTGDQRALNPSDFGFHNAIRRSDGHLVFIDFEYFGWDDPCKMIADGVLHPGTTLPSRARQGLYRHLAPLFRASDANFNPRFRFLLRICGLFWCLILLNEFLPAGLARREMAGRIEDAAAAQARQLDKARMMLAWVEERFRRDRHPHAARGGA